MRVFALVTDAYGGRGGIALYNRNVLSSICRHPARPDVVAIPRAMPYDRGALPDGLTFAASATKNAAHYVGTLLNQGFRRRPDLIVCGHINLLPIAEVVRRRWRAPVMLFVYGIDAWGPQRKSRAPSVGGLRDALVPRADAIVSIRDVTTRRLSSWADVSRTPIHLLENAIDPAKYGAGPTNAALVKRYGLAGKRVLITLARTDDEDFGCDEVLSVLPDLARDIPELVYMIAGSGVRLKALREKANSLGVAERVIFTGEVSEDEKADHLRLADAFAMPGSATAAAPVSFDRYPIRFSFLEAMACGLPIVASTPEEGGDGRYDDVPNVNVDPTDANSLKRGLKVALARGRGPVPKALERFTVDAFAARLHSIMDEVCAAN